MAITFQNLYADLPVQYVCIEEFQMQHGLNQHGKAQIKVLLEEGEEKGAIEKFSFQKALKIYENSEEEQTIFRGFPVKVEMTHIGTSFWLDIDLRGASILMDIKKKRRSFQNMGETYQNMLNKICAEHGGHLKDLASKGAKKKGPYIQYDETDWVFIKRMASCLGTVVYSPLDSEACNIVMGLQKSKQYSVSDMPYGVQKDIEKYHFAKDNGGNGDEKSCMVITFQSTELYHVGDEVTIKNMRGIVKSLKSKMEKGRLITKYKICQEKGIFQIQKYNQRIAGVSIEGTVLEIDKHLLKVKLCIDKNQKTEEAYAYPFSTNYVANSATGWYAMPEAGSSVNLYIPKQDETAAYIAKVNRTDGASNPKTSDPATKFFGTKEGREMKLAPSEITFSAVEGETYLTLSDEGGVTWNTPNDIKINGTVLTGNCESLDITSKDKIVLVTRGASIVVDNVTHIKG